MDNKYYLFEDNTSQVLGFAKGKNANEAFLELTSREGQSKVRCITSDVWWHEIASEGRISDKIMTEVIERRKND